MQATNLPQSYTLDLLPTGEILAKLSHFLIELQIFAQLQLPIAPTTVSTRDCPASMFSQLLIVASWKSRSRPPL